MLNVYGLIKNRVYNYLVTEFLLVSIGSWKCGLECGTIVKSYKYSKNP